MELRILHFNDVYHIDDVDLLSKFSSALHAFRNASASPTLTIFSGDAFSPSLEASVLRGDHMVDLLNAMEIDVACFGNHDFDFGEERLQELAVRSSFPWTLTNLVHGDQAQASRTWDSFISEGKPMPERSLPAGASPFVVREVGGVRLGFFGLAGTDWPSNCQHLPKDSSILDPVRVAKGMARHLRVREKCAVVIALTHMRLAEDLGVSNVTGPGCDPAEYIDLLLGGHDHEVVFRRAGENDADASHPLEGRKSGELVKDGCILPGQGNIRIIKSGTDWEGYSSMTVTIDEQSDNLCPAVRGVKLSQTVNLKSTQGYSTLPQDDSIRQILSQTRSKITGIVQHPLWHTHVPLNGVSSVVRCQETSLCNLISDAIRAFYNVDIALVNGGGIRCNRTIPPSDLNAPLAVKDLIEIVPFDQPFVVLRVPGAALRTALENSVSDAHTDGRFLHPSGLAFAADWQAREGARVRDVRVDARRPSEYSAEETWSELWGPTGVGLDESRKYTVAMVKFLADGFDGYSCFKDCEVVVDGEGAMTDAGLMLQVLGYRPNAEGRGHGEAGKTNASTEDGTDVGIDRARGVVVKGYLDDRLPFVHPLEDSRIRLSS